MAAAVAGSKLIMYHSNCWLIYTAGLEQLLYYSTLK
jgi:hypothetical protein